MESPKLPQLKFESSEKEREYRNQIDNEQAKQYGFEIDSVGKYLLSVTKSQHKYIERIAIDPEGEIAKSDVYVNGRANVLARVQSVAATRKSLNQIVQNLRSKYKNFEITTHEQPEEIVLTVENKVKPGSLVYWESQGAVQWAEPRRVVHISEDGFYAFVDGSMTGLPIEQLEAAS